jgi:hypothetical protein
MLITSYSSVDRRQEKAKNDPMDSAGPTRHPMEEMEVDGAGSTSGQQGDSENKLLVLLSNECCQLENEKK